VAGKGAAVAAVVAGKEAAIASAVATAVLEQEAKHMLLEQQLQHTQQEHAQQEHAQQEHAQQVIFLCRDSLKQRAFLI
jgi:hypothetical protein